MYGWHVDRRAVLGLRDSGDAVCGLDMAGTGPELTRVREARMPGLCDGWQVWAAVGVWLAAAVAVWLYLERAHHA